MKNLKKEWLGNIRGDLLSGIVVAIALVPEAIAFSIIAGLSPMVGLYSAFCISIVVAIAGGRAGMISGATGAMALVLASLVRNHGIEYVLVATLLTGVLQIIFGVLKIGTLLRFIPKPVMIGFVNALAIMIFKSQLTYFKGAGIMMYILVAVGIAIIYLFPKITKAIPAPLVAIVGITAFVLLTNSDVSRIGDMGTITGSLPNFLLPNVPLNLETLRIILPTSFSLAIVGLTESMLTARILDEKTDTASDKNRECVGQGIANVVTGFFGGMAGCAMIGQSVINHKSGGRGRLSTFSAGAFLMILIVLLNQWLVQIPLAVLISVMIVVSISTFEWESLKRIRLVPKSDTFVMIATVIVVYFTENLAYGVIIGIILSSLFFAKQISNTKVVKTPIVDGVKFVCKGQLFFASTTHFIEKFDYNLEEKYVELDMNELKLWDESAGDAFDKVVLKYNEKNIEVKVSGLNKHSKKLLLRTSKSLAGNLEFAD